ncbi:hypothetical protein H9P43_007938 [Blastocladiella emersonii ATCC 22665]|nr:hypothetical protein H9P43_007938 [Blastocladiella emersonii ATCC 22665]
MPDVPPRSVAGTATATVTAQGYASAYLARRTQPPTPMDALTRSSSSGSSSAVSVSDTVDGLYNLVSDSAHRADEAAAEQSRRAGLISAKAMASATARRCRIIQEKQERLKREQEEHRVRTLQERKERYRRVVEATRPVAPAKAPPESRRPRHVVQRETDESQSLVHQAAALPGHGDGELPTLPSSLPRPRVPTKIQYKGVWDSSKSLRVVKGVAVESPTSPGDDADQSPPTSAYTSRSPSPAHHHHSDGYGAPSPLPAAPRPHEPPRPPPSADPVFSRRAHPPPPAAIARHHDTRPPPSDPSPTDPPPPSVVTPIHADLRPPRYDPGDDFSDSDDDNLPNGPDGLGLSRSTGDDPSRPGGGRLRTARARRGTTLISERALQLLESNLRLKASRVLAMSTQQSARASATPRLLQPFPRRPSSRASGSGRAGSRRTSRSVSPTAWAAPSPAATIIAVGGEQGQRKLPIPLPPPSPVPPKPPRIVAAPEPVRAASGSASRRPSARFASTLEMVTAAGSHPPGSAGTSRPVPPPALRRSSVSSSCSTGSRANSAASSSAAARNGSTTDHSGPPPPPSLPRSARPLAHDPIVLGRVVAKPAAAAPPPSTQAKLKETLECLEAYLSSDTPAPVKPAPSRLPVPVASSASTSRASSSRSSDTTSAARFIPAPATVPPPSSSTAFFIPFCEDPKDTAAVESGAQILKKLPRPRTASARKLASRAAPAAHAHASVSLPKVPSAEAVDRPHLHHRPHHVVAPAHHHHRSGRPAAASHEPAHRHPGLPFGHTAAVARHSHPHPHARHRRSRTSSPSRSRDETVTDHHHQPYPSAGCAPGPSEGALVASLTRLSAEIEDRLKILGVQPEPSLFLGSGSAGRSGSGSGSGSGLPRGGGGKLTASRCGANGSGMLLQPQR